MAARNSPESSSRNSPLHSDSVTAKPSRRPDTGKAVEVEIDDFLKRLGGRTVAQAFGQGVVPEIQQVGTLAMSCIHREDDRPDNILMPSFRASPGHGKKSRTVTRR